MPMTTDTLSLQETADSTLYSVDCKKVASVFLVWVQTFKSTECEPHVNEMTILSDMMQAFCGSLSVALFIVSVQAIGTCSRVHEDRNAVTGIDLKALKAETSYTVMNLP